MEANGFVIKNNYFKNPSFVGHNGIFGSLLTAQIFPDEISCEYEINKISHRYKEVDSYKMENMEIKKVAIKIEE